MKNSPSIYLTHPEALWIFLALLLIFMFVIPLFHLYLFKRKLTRFENLKTTYGAIENEPIGQTTTCNFCGSQRSKHELIIDIPIRAKFGFFFIKEHGFYKLYQVRCGKCNTSLFSFVEKSD